jgi:hypothetical protein
MNRTITIVAWTEAALGGVLLITSAVALTRSYFGPQSDDPHQFALFGAFIGVLVGAALLTGGVLLRLAAPWRWIAQVVALAFALWAASPLVGFSW